MTDLLIDQALAIEAAARPVRLSGPGIDLTPAQALVHTVYLAARDLERQRPLLKKGSLDRYVRMALSARIPQHEVDAAVERAKAPLAAPRDAG